ncbi:MAG: NAD(P)H-hydrate dehydratase [Treponema sp.]|nr:NAD(P)H-hydrate dehydratase [Spirochaetales bacterium]MDY6189943.1 NAD(P)H-hydrate dehydratase [Treponema sp.]
MKKVFENPSELETLAKQALSIPPFLMMENAARFLSDFVISIIKNKRISQIVILCGKGNNGGDGFALARLLCTAYENLSVTILVPQLPVAEEAKMQFEMCQKLAVQTVFNDKIITFLQNLEANSQKPDFFYETQETQVSYIIVDCLFGIGFHGELSKEFVQIFDILNKIKAVKIACDIPSALYFQSDFTITMGAHKTVLFSDKAKVVCGKIIQAPLGIPPKVFESFLPPVAFLLEMCDAKFPFRKNKSAHKGTYGHTAVIACQKSGAAILAATSALNFGSGLTSLVKTSFSDLEQFKISAELMINCSIPDKTTAVILGPGFCEDENSISIFDEVLEWFNTTENPAILLDAGVFGCRNFISFLTKLNSVLNAKIVLTPHLLEMSRFLHQTKDAFPEKFQDFEDNDFSVQVLANDSNKKIALSKRLMQIFPNVTIVIKSANTFIATENQVFICDEGRQNLAKGGSGDVLAGLIGSLLAQKYSAKEAAITGVWAHANASKRFGEEAYDLTPEKLIHEVSKTIMSNRQV